MMKSVFYIMSGLKEWVDVAEKLYDSEGWKPVYWMTQIEKNHKQVLAKFPDIVAHPSQHANKCIPAEGFEDCFSYPLDKDILLALKFNESVALEMMDRMDLHDSFRYLDRVRLYNRLLMYWFRMIEKLEPDMIVFNTPPHSIAEYTLYAVATFLKIRTPIYITTGIDGLIYVNDSVEQASETLKKRYEEIVNNKYQIEMTDVLSDYLSSVRSKSDVAAPWYVPIVQEQREKRERAYNKKLSRKKISASKLTIIDRVKYVLNINNKKDEKKKKKIKISDGRQLNRIFKLKNVPLEETDITRGEYNAHLRKIYQKKLEYKQLYLSLCEDIDLSVPYIYVPLHYQPERTTCPDGGLFSDQMIMINILANCIPAGWYLYIKEHATQFSYHGNGDMCRNNEFYLDMNNLPSVKYIDLESNTYDLIDNAKAVATVTGMAGWEAVCRAKPALVFGNAWYQICDGVYKIENTDECRYAMNLIKQGLEIEDYQVDAFVNALSDISTLGYVNSTNATPVEITYDQHVAQLYEAMKNYCDAFHHSSSIV